MLSETVVERSLNSVVRILLESNGIKIGMQVEATSIQKVDFDEIASKISSFIALIEEIGVVQRLMNISNNVQQISGHKGSLEGNTIPVVSDH